MNQLKKDKIVLAYSGGLDTSVILRWLMEKGYQVIAYVADVGQQEDFALIEKKALKTGACKVYIEDLKREFISDYIFPALKANAVYEGRYLLGTAIARPLIAKRQIEIANQEGAKLVSHGATGKGNDQVRFELAYYALNPQIRVLSPWRTPEFLEQFKGRSDLIQYANTHGIEIKSTVDTPFSEDDNLLHISHEGGILEAPDFEPPEDIYTRTLAIEKAPDQPTMLSIYFRNGIPIRVENRGDGVVFEDPYDLFLYLNELGRLNAIGRLDIVENRFVGIKSRGIYETPGGTILHMAHRDIEGIAMDREVMHLRDMLSVKLSELIYNGFWFSPEMSFLMAAIEKSQEHIDGVVHLKLYKGGIYITGRQSPTSLYDQELSSMNAIGGFNQKDAEGFIKINALRLMAHKAILDKENKTYNS